MTNLVDPAKESFARLREMTREGPVHMLKLIRLCARAAHDDGREASGPSGALPDRRRAGSSPDFAP
ncbi:MAG: hypothetical protein Kow0032_22040 [Methyloligellaceae bacterium]